MMAAHFLCYSHLKVCEKRCLPNIQGISTLDSLPRQIYTTTTRQLNVVYMSSHIPFQIYDVHVYDVFK